MNKTSRVSQLYKTSLLLSTTFLLLNALSGCASAPIAAPTPYKAATVKSSYGYSSKKVSESDYVVLFKATDKTPADLVQQYALHRAAEIAEKQNFSHLEIVKTNVEKKPQLAREVVASNEPPQAFQNTQCTMSGCEEVAQPMAGATSNDIVKTQINDVYYTITVKMANSAARLGKKAFSARSVLETPLKRKK